MKICIMKNYSLTWKREKILNPKKKNSQDYKSSRKKYLRIIKVPAKSLSGSQKVPRKVFQEIPRKDLSGPLAHYQVLTAIIALPESIPKFRPWQRPDALILSSVALVHALVQTMESSVALVHTLVQTMAMNQCPENNHSILTQRKN